MLFDLSDVLTTEGKVINIDVNPVVDTISTLRNRRIPLNLLQPILVVTR